MKLIITLCLGLLIITAMGCSTPAEEPEPIEPILEISENVSDSDIQIELVEDEDIPIGDMY